MDPQSPSNARPPQDQRRFNGLMHAGKEAFDKGNRKLAHDLWREAASLNPYDEQVWLALFRVLDNDEDRIVCLENIIAINPLNVKARRRLRAYEVESAKATAEIARTLVEKDTRRLKQQKQTKQLRRRRTRQLINAILIGLIGGALAGVLLSIVLYGL
jgi:2,3-bisphosphoglycerate-independent phosphoglycerate mutase